MRRLQTGNYHVWKGSKTGARSEDIIVFEAEELAPGAYRAKTSGALRPGEYAFYYGAEGTTTLFGINVGEAGKLFDFSVGQGAL